MHPAGCIYARLGNLSQISHAVTHSPVSQSRCDTLHFQGHNFFRFVTKDPNIVDPKIDATVAKVAVCCLLDSQGGSTE